MKKILRYILELSFFPNLSLFLFYNETWLRLRPIKKFLKIIDPEKNKRIIDIGGGTGRLEMQIGRMDITIYDQDEKSIKIAKNNFKNAIIGTGTNITLNDNSFDWVISVHTLEHIPKRNRKHFILEMIRISKEGVYMNFPEGKYAEKLCKNFISALEKKGMEANKWTLEHLEMGLPTIEEINSIIETQNKFHFDYKFVRNYYAENLYWTRLRTTKNIILRYVFSPLLALYKYSFIERKPTIELILVGSKNQNILKNIIRKL